MPTTTVPLWLDEPIPARPALDGDLTVDVCIVGGGIGGLSTAWHLAARGVRATLVEARGVATGASGRNGGFFLAGAAPFYNDARRLYGRDVALALYRATLAAQQEIYALAPALGVADAFRRNGALRVATTPEEAAHVREQAACLAGDGLPGELLEEDALEEPIRRPGRVALLTPHDGGFHPARWLRGLAAGLEQRGVRLVERTPVGPPARDGGGYRLAHPAGTIRAEQVVVASDAALPALVPLYARSVRCRRLHMVATAPVARHVDACPVYARWGYEYHQQLPDGRVTLGGLSDVDGPRSYVDREEPDPAIHEGLAAYLREELGVEEPVTHRWVGLVGYAHDHRAYAGAVPGQDGLSVLGGYSGTGNVNGWVAGRIVAEEIVDGASPDAAIYDSRRILDVPEDAVPTHPGQPDAPGPITDPARG